VLSKPFAVHFMPPLPQVLDTELSELMFALPAILLILTFDMGKLPYHCMLEVYHFLIYFTETHSLELS
jgi:hypothetical protein